MLSSKRVVLNTVILYGRMLLVMGISIYSTRIVLNALGNRDYGIFNLIAGIIAMLSFLNVAMSTSTQRFLSYYQGKDDLNMQRMIFSNSLFLHILIGFLLVISLEVVGFFLFDGFLRIPVDRIATAKAVYHFMAATVFFTVIEVPFTGTLNARENIGWLALVNITEASLKLFSAVFILSKLSTDRLMIYGFLNPCISIFSTILYSSYCLTKYKECTLRLLNRIEKSLLNKLASFAGWNLFGALCTLAKTQGLAILLNIFFGTVVNAAYGIANQIAAQLNFLSATLFQVINPQIMKSQGSGDTERMLRLSMIASKFSFFLMVMVSLPCIFEMNQILKFWLKNVPQNTVIFCDLILVSILINQLTIGLQSAIQANGKIKNYQAFIGTLILFNLPIAYILLKLKLPAYAALFSFSIIEIVACLFRLYFANSITGLKIRDFIVRVILKEIIPVAISVLICFLTSHYLEFKFRFLVTGFVSAIFFSLSIYIFGLNKDERITIERLIVDFVNKVSKRKELVS